MTRSNRDFYDIPRAVLVEVDGQAYFLDCPFDEEADDYGDDFVVYRLPETVAQVAHRPDSSWVDLARAGSLLGRVPVRDVTFNRQQLLLDTAIFDRFS